MFEIVGNRTTVGAAEPIDRRSPAELESDKVHAEVSAKLKAVNDDVTLSAEGKRLRSDEIWSGGQAKLDAIWRENDQQQAAALAAAEKRVFGLTGTVADNRSARAAAASVATPEQARAAIAAHLRHSDVDAATAVAEVAWANAAGDPLGGKQWQAVVADFVEATGRADSLAVLRRAADPRATAMERLMNSRRRRLS